MAGPAEKYWVCSPGSLIGRLSEVTPAFSWAAVPPKVVQLPVEGTSW